MCWRDYKDDDQSMIGSMIRSDRAILKNNVLFRKRNARKVKKREETRARATSVVSQKLRRRRRHQVETVIEKSSLWFKYKYNSLYVVASWKNRSREELLKKKKRERERVRTYSPSQKQKKKRSDCLVFKVCVCVLRVWIFWRRSNLSYYFKRKAQKEREIFSSCVHF